MPVPAFPDQYPERIADGSRMPVSTKRASGQMDCTRGLAAQCHAYCARPSGRLASTAGMGNFHRCGHPGFVTAKIRSRIPAMGQLRASQEYFNRHKQAPHTQDCPPLAPVSPPRLFRLPAFFANQPDPCFRRTGTDRLGFVHTLEWMNPCKPWQQPRAMPHGSRQGLDRSRGIESRPEERLRRSQYSIPAISKR